MTQKPEIHQSMLGLLSKCGQAAKFRYVDGIKAPPGVALHVGKATHKSVQVNLAHKRDNGALLDADAVAQAAAEALDVSWEQDPPMLDDDERERGEPKVRGAAKDQSVSLALVHHKRVAPQIQPTKLEHKIVLELPDAPFDVGGTLDIVEESPEIVVIRDTKTASRAPAEGTAARSVQLQLYGWMYEQAHGRPVAAGAIDTVVKGSVRSAPSVHFDAAPMPPSFEHIFMRLEAAARVFETGAFMPVDPTGPDSWICSPRWCGYWSRCPYGERARRTI